MRVWLKEPYECADQETESVIVLIDIFALTFEKEKVKVMDDGGIHEYPISCLIMVAD